MICTKIKNFVHFSGLHDINGLRCTNSMYETEWNSMARLIGYARVSTDGQTLHSQVETLEAAGATVIFRETASGARTDRAQLARAIAALRAGDTLIVTRLDRLARSTRDLLNTLAAVAERGATFRSLADTWADTTTPHGRLLLTILGGLAEFERSLILARTSEGRRRAVDAGVKLGRRSSLTLHQQAEVIKRRGEGESLTALARSYGVAHPTIIRVLRRHEARL
jgi:DNA invertase Pin-like site-specific DNA recombinase